jgi:S1-C subfamily serine protease
MLHRGCLKARATTCTILWALVCVVPQLASALEPAEIYERWGNAVVTVIGPRGFGSGFVIPPAGYVVTSLHVVKGQDRLQVLLPSGERRAVTSIRAQDEKRDLAILGIDPTGLPRVILGDSSAVRPGDRVVAIGTPEGLRHTITEGIISQIRGIDGITILQTQTPISQGSSGGPLFNKNGEVIGINFASKRSGQNLNFAVAINELRALIGEPVKGMPQISPLALPQPQSSPPPEPSPEHAYSVHLHNGQVIQADDVQESGDVIGIIRPGVSFSVPRASVARIVRHEDKTVREISRAPAPPAAEATSPPKAGEPLLLIRMFNGSEIVAEKIWAQGDRVIYERAGFRGSVRAVDVLALIDRDLEVKLAVCSVKFREVEAKIREMQQTARDLRQEGFTLEERQAIAGAQDRIIHLEAGQAKRLCDQALAKWSQNMRMLQEAQRRSNSKR